MHFIAAHLRVEAAGVALILLLAVFGLIVRGVAPDEVAKIYAQLWGVWCWTYVIRWKLKMASLHKVVSTFLGVLFAASFYVVIEVGLTCINILLSEPWHLPNLHAPRWLEILLLLLSLIMVRHHWREWKHRRLNADMPQILERVLRILDKDRSKGGGSWTSKTRETYLDETLMKEMKLVLERDSKRVVAFSIMEPNTEGELAIIYSYPKNSPFQGNFRLKSDEGAAGAAYTRRNSIYVPSTMHLMAIDIEKNETIGQIYKPDPADSPFHCVLCVPIISNTGAVTVLNISCTEVSSFDLFEFSIGRLMAVIIAILG